MSSRRRPRSPRPAVGRRTSWSTSSTGVLRDTARDDWHRRAPAALAGAACVRVTVRQHTHTTSNVRRSGKPCDCSPRVMAGHSPPLRSPHALCSSVAAGDFGTAWRATLRTREVALLERAAGVPARAVSPGVLAFLTDRLRGDAELCRSRRGGCAGPDGPADDRAGDGCAQLVVHRGAFVLSFTYDAVLSSALRGWPERHYDQHRRAWLLPASRDVAHRLRALLKGRGFHVTPDAAKLGARLLRGGAHAPWPRLEVLDADDERLALWVAPLLRPADWPLVAEQLTAVGARYDARAPRPGTWIVERGAAEGDTPAARAARGRRGPRHGRGAAGCAGGARYGRDPRARARRAVGRVVSGSQTHAF